jgi:hypothetical protein
MVPFSLGKTVVRRAQNLLSGRPIVFHHVPKCGGSSVERALKMRYPLSYSVVNPGATWKVTEALTPELDGAAKIAENFRFREEQLLYWLHHGVQCVMGHVRFSEHAYEAFHDRYLFAATLREPVALFNSWFHYGATHPNDRWTITQSMDDFLASERAADYGRILTFYFSGLSPTEDLCSAEAIERAKKNIDALDVIGFVEDMPSFKKSLERSTGVGLRLPHVNKSRVESMAQNEAMTDERRRVIEQLCAPSVEVYKHARAKVAALAAS